MTSPLLGRFLVSFNLQSASCGLQPAVCSLQSTVCKCHTPRNYTLHRFQFKGRAYELKYRAYGFCLNKQQANLLQYVGVIFSKSEKIITYLKFAKIQRPLQSECIKNTTVEFTFGRSFSSLPRRTPSFFCFTYSSDVPLQITRGLMGQMIGTEVIAEQKRCEY